MLNWEYEALGQIVFISTFSFIFFFLGRYFIKLSKRLNNGKIERMLGIILTTLFFCTLPFLILAFIGYLGGPRPGTPFLL